MIRVFVRPACAAALLMATLIPVAARAQTPTGMPQPGGGMGAEEETKPEGVAEKAPADPSKVLAPPTYRPWPGEEKKRFEHLSLDGYMRLRTDWFDNFNLGFNDFGSGTPFRVPLACKPSAGVTTGCSESLGSGNMRLRLEPTYWVTEKVAVRMQIDMLDNLVLGATPEGTFFNAVPSPSNIPTSAFTGGQAAPEAGRNYISDSIRVKRAWAEVMTPLGLLKFGRMPSHWGLGILANSGGEDTFHSNDDPFYRGKKFCTDCDAGDTADRVMFGTKIPGTNFSAAVGMDWASTGPTAAQVDIWNNRTDGQPWDLEDTDDVRQWLFVLANLDKPEDWAEKIKLGELAINYGVYLVYRAQQFSSGNVTLGSTNPENLLRQRDAEAYIPDVYFRLGKGKLNFEAEAVAVIGSISDLTDIFPGLNDQEVLQFGAVGRLNYLMVDDDLNLGFEVGTASGDQWDPTLPGVTNPLDAPVVPGMTDKQITNFHFDFNYHVDLILFRELLGTVSNATYLKPALSYDLTDKITFKAAAIISFANVLISTPGNGYMYGVELDGDLGYHNEDEGFFAGISYGVLFPLDAMDHPSDLRPDGTPLFSTEEQGDASTAQTVQIRAVVQF